MITEMNRKLKGKTFNEKFLWNETMAKFLMKQANYSKVNQQVCTVLMIFNDLGKMKRSANS